MTNNYFRIHPLLSVPSAAEEFIFCLDPATSSELSLCLLPLPFHPPPKHPSEGPFENASWPMSLSGLTMSQWLPRPSDYKAAIHRSLLIWLPWPLSHLTLCHHHRSLALRRMSSKHPKSLCQLCSHILEGGQAHPALEAQFICSSGSPTLFVPQAHLDWVMCSHSKPLGHPRFPLCGTYFVSDFSPYILSPCLCTLHAAQRVLDHTQALRDLPGGGPVPLCQNVPSPPLPWAATHLRP